MVQFLGIIFIVFLLGFGLNGGKVEASSSARLCDVEALGSSGFWDIMCEGYRVQLDCSLRSANFFVVRLGMFSVVGSEKPSVKREGIRRASNIPARCQQKHGGKKLPSYNKALDEKNVYDKGHLVMRFHLQGSDSAEAVLQTDFSFNVLPQRRRMNRFVWNYTEDLTECYRKAKMSGGSGGLYVLGGPLWDKKFLLGGDDKHDKFAPAIKAVHGIDIPTAFWKLVVFDEALEVDGRFVKSVGWIIPNLGFEGVKQDLAVLDSYVHDVSEIRREIGRLGILDEPSIAREFFDELEFEPVASQTPFCE